MVSCRLAPKEARPRSDNMLNSETGSAIPGFGSDGMVPQKRAEDGAFQLFEWELARHVATLLSTAGTEHAMALIQGSEAVCVPGAGADAAMQLAALLPFVGCEHPIGTGKAKRTLGAPRVEDAVARLLPLLASLDQRDFDELNAVSAIVSANCNGRERFLNIVKNMSESLNVADQVSSLGAMVYSLSGGPRQARQCNHALHTIAPMAAPCSSLCEHLSSADKIH